MFFYFFNTNFKSLFFFVFILIFAGLKAFVRVLDDGCKKTSVVPPKCAASAAHFSCPVTGAKRGGLLRFRRPCSQGNFAEAPLGRLAAGGRHSLDKGGTQVLSLIIAFSVFENNIAYFSGDCKWFFRGIPRVPRYGASSWRFSC